MEKKFEPSKLFKNQDFGISILKHRKLPIYVTNEFNFYRCVTFNETFYGKTVSELHRGNLRSNTPENRHSKLFPDKKISYWADSPITARAEVKYHNKHSNNLLTFWAYDDLTSTFPTLENEEPLIIIDGREADFGSILEKVEEEVPLTDKEQDVIKLISEQNPDCLVYESKRNEGGKSKRNKGGKSKQNKVGLNYLFFEKGFNKLSIREVRLRLGDELGKNTNRIICAGTSDYVPCPENYGMYFMPITQVKICREYKEEQECLRRTEICNRSLDRIKKLHLI